MKPIQLMFDERLLRSLDADEEVRKLGRSEVVRRLVSEYLRRRRAAKTDEDYRKAYQGGEGPGEEWAGWEAEGSWPEK